MQRSEEGDWLDGLVHTAPVLSAQLTVLGMPPDNPE